MRVFEWKGCIKVPLTLSSDGWNDRIAEAMGDMSDCRDAIEEARYRSDTEWDGTSSICPCAKVRAVRIDRLPEKIIHDYNESVRFEAVVTPPSERLVYRWSVDGVVHFSETGSSFIQKFTPVPTTTECHRDYEVRMDVCGLTAASLVRVARDTDDGEDGT